MAREVLLPRQTPCTTRLLDEVALMAQPTEPTPYELEKARLVNYISAIQAVLDEHRVKQRLKSILETARNAAEQELHQLGEESSK